MDPRQQNPMFFDFAAPGPMHPLDADVQNDPLVSNDMMSMFDMSNFNDIPMNLDDYGDLAPPQEQSFPHVSNPTPPSTLAPTDGPSRFSSGSDDSPVGGPTPANTGFGGPMQQPTQSVQSGSALTEFTKRRNWPAKVVEELKDVFHILDANGRIKYVSPGIYSLTGYDAADIVDTFLKEIVHPDDIGTFTSEMNECIATGNPLRMFYRMKKKDQQYAIFEAVGHAHIAAAKFAPNPSNRSPFCQAVFLMSRPYPTRNAALLDSFLEHKIENERLRRRIAELRREEDEEEASQQSWLQEARSDITPSDDTIMSNSQNPPIFKQTVSGSQVMPPPERPPNGGLTRENLEGVTAGSRPDSIGDKMARYEGACFTDAIEMLTGLRYVEGERSRGVTTGSSSLTLVKGDIGIAIPVDRDPKTGEKKKKLKIAEEYVCTDCGTLDSPEWRKGPSGPKTLCNACGLRWAKREKKRVNGTSNNTALPLSMPTGDP
ncbi:putative cutinase palindrome-binding protein [Rosellinia necatrix]|uniref:Putative cutinase palindrome-binding protein n=1 Tax=Rosellinia necatrix TaxID=77044 RepID=A0A1S7ULZ4_ROSNE|nr:putative cutinase palindrome-binding protein [Rosellinia necatrix]